MDSTHTDPHHTLNNDVVKHFMLQTTSSLKAAHLDPTWRTFLRTLAKTFGRDKEDYATEEYFTDLFRAIVCEGKLTYNVLGQIIDFPQVPLKQQCQYKVPWWADFVAKCIKDKNKPHDTHVNGWLETMV